MASQQEHLTEVSEDEKHSVDDPQLTKDGKVMKVKNADLALALSTGTQLTPFSPTSIQLFLILLVAFMGSMSNGFDGQVCIQILFLLLFNKFRSCLL